MNQSDTKGKIFIGGLSWSTNNESLKKYFSKFGEVTDAIVMVHKESGRSRGFGFVTYKDPDSVHLALSQSNHVLDDKKVDPKSATNKPPPGSGGIETRSSDSPNKVFIGGVASNCSREDIMEYFKQFGTVLDVHLVKAEAPDAAGVPRHRGFGFVTFESQDIVQRLLKLQFVDIHGKQVEIKKAEAKRKYGGGDAGQYGNRGPQPGPQWGGPPPGQWGGPPQGQWGGWNNAGAGGQGGWGGPPQPQPPQQQWGPPPAGPAPQWNQQQQWAPHAGYGQQPPQGSYPGWQQPSQQPAQQPAQQPVQQPAQQPGSWDNSGSQPGYEQQQPSQQGWQQQPQQQAQQQQQQSGTGYGQQQAAPAAQQPASTYGGQQQQWAAPPAADTTQQPGGAQQQPTPNASGYGIQGGYPAQDGGYAQQQGGGPSAGAVRPQQRGYHPYGR